MLCIAPVLLEAGPAVGSREDLATTVVVTARATTDHTARLEAARTLAVDAIVLDVVAPTAMAQLIGALAAHRVLRPTRVERTSRGERQPRSAGYALVARDGTLKAPS